MSPAAVVRAHAGSHFSDSWTEFPHAGPRSAALRSRRRAAASGSLRQAPVTGSPAPSSPRTGSPSPVISAVWLRSSRAMFTDDLAHWPTAVGIPTHVC